ncbi:amidohydrolase [Paenibacillus sp. CAA11]|uniref:M20 metallopeptidase family protein n=1 Tax=Paenibacillus sp. CAA11 TaxID=1532905 RepID=UPI000D332712|nr:amidohydrolase [Paenibacillus sp. CAA11]AWB45182.1 amidohydrolase [Paenibacillus sp. CAA11]
MDWEELKSRHPLMVTRRRYLHQHPELSFHEGQTAAYVAEILSQAGIPYRMNVGGHGIVASIQGELPGKTVALRADMDALPIQDEKSCAYASTVPGVMHACGHDGHTATLLAVAEYFASRRSELHGEVRFLFQPAEEVCPGGAVGMIEGGALDGVDVIYGVHLWTPISVGKAASAPGPLMASTDEFFVDIHGRGGHGGMPHNAVDSVVAGASLVMQLQSVVSRSVNPLDPAVVTIGAIQGGTVQNVIAERCRLSGTVRCFREETRVLIRERISELVEHTGKAYGAEATVQYVLGYPTLMNHPGETERFFQVCAEVPSLSPELTQPIMPAEDFAYYLQKVPGCFVLVGAGNSDKGVVYPHHHPMFDFDENAILNAAGLLISLTESFMSDL